MADTPINNNRELTTPMKGLVCYGPVNIIEVVKKESYTNVSNISFSITFVGE